MSLFIQKYLNATWHYFVSKSSPKEVWDKWITLCFAVRSNESTTLMISSKFRPVVAGYKICRGSTVDKYKKSSTVPEASASCRDRSRGRHAQKGRCLEGVNTYRNSTVPLSYPVHWPPQGRSFPAIRRDDENRLRWSLQNAIIISDSESTQIKFWVAFYSKKLVNYLLWGCLRKSWTNTNGVKDNNYKNVRKGNLSFSISPAYAEMSSIHARWDDDESMERAINWEITVGYRLT